MTTLVKFILGITLSMFTEEAPKKDLAFTNVSAKYPHTVSKDSIQTKAYTILENKCNICHMKRNKRRVFTKENMTPSVNDIYKQVFIKRRMPKGRSNKLTPQEYQELLTWITSIKNKSHGI